ncbi:Exodeoxyribonuclease 7 large subunit [Caldithrix abyssi DSM 13497]|uniref:Exodeoxyribonuclease 7 large subunit n=1 Tax=Caldithrix abyssi DSM 13497 TaxID=880073 RepID=H1XPG1_CALAY|nr:exodeoxyribonuclease VII large subunit [Caldithrix abyssi]APF19440.1 xseA Exodeoxyribonuclease VII large subunit [Caldithrix abyssi DSM 13497]EHO43332.1 Exodeoxyribonuclease 7 large subunit [Caldithrix abyssi DSM 13497]
MWTEDTHIFSVSELTHTIKKLLEENIPTIWLEGEVSNFKAHSSGHYYFTLKDEQAQISAVIWRSRVFNIDFKLEDGMHVQALGNVRVFERSGRYNFDIIHIQPAGIGRLQMEFERLKKQLAAEGLFDSKFKKPIPKFPLRVGVVTSDTGAAIKDIINVLSRRAPHVQIILRPVQVQGEGAARDIARAIKEFNEYGKVDVLIVGRGGGSLEDLWAFNEETVARAIFDSKIPVISAVGHEIDYTIADFVADLRAPTPSAAAELAVPDFNEIKQSILLYGQRLKRAVVLKIERHKQQLESIRRSYGLRRLEDILHQYAYRVDELTNQLIRNYEQNVSAHKRHLEQINLRLLNLNPKKVLERGYSISYINGQVLKDAAMVKSGEEIRTELFKGEILGRVTKVVKGK